MATTYKNTNNSLLFFTAKHFLDAIDTIFQFRFVESKENKWVLEFRPVNEIIWERKPISIALTTNNIEYNNMNTSVNKMQSYNPDDTTKPTIRQTVNNIDYSNIIVAANKNQSYDPNNTTKPTTRQTLNNIDYSI